MGKRGFSLWPFRRPRRPHTEEDVEALRRDFRRRYESFRHLLEANHRALELMGQLDARLQGTPPPEMSWARAISARIGARVWHMVRRLEELAPERYTELGSRFQAITTRIGDLSAPQADPTGGACVVGLSEIRGHAQRFVGNKLGNLAAIRNVLGLPVPDGFAVTTRGTTRFLGARWLREEIDQRLQFASEGSPDDLFRACAEIEALVREAEIPEELSARIRSHYEALEAEHGKGVGLAVRSSALQEDSAGASFAGQFKTVLNVRGDTVLAAFKEVVASQYSAAATQYRWERGLEAAAMSVGFLVMVDPKAAGVAYSRSPVDVGDDATYIQSAWGLGTSVVEGSGCADLFVVGRGDPPAIVRREIPFQPSKVVCDEDGGTRVLDLSMEEGRNASLSDETVLELAAMVRRLEEFYGAPQDVEWAVDRGGQIYLLQSRTLAQQEPAEAADTEESAGPVAAEGGVAASLGAAAGRAFVVRTRADAGAFPAGGVLVTEQARPEWAPLLTRAAAIVTERGTFAGHLASVARELHLPALLGVEGAVRRLRGRDEVTVDADHRRVYAGRIESLLTRARPRRDLKAGSRVFTKMGELSSVVTRLNLLDPDAHEFVPAHCESLHDIMRFCHEKSVAAMFRFGRDHQLPERSSKQLHCDVPMQWWVLNLDDGFAMPVEGKFVHLDNIVSVPMRSLWDGIVAVPWQGPPPIDAKGFLSVMFGATRNPALIPVHRSSLGERSYFLISKNYCSLSMRLGAHFSIVEAIVSEDVRENYASLQFKGGAADDQRRLQRVRLIGTILAEFGFRTTVHGDSLVARVEGYEPEYMESRLRILGYLCIHTRQLDMIMARPALVQQYRNKIIEDLTAVGADTGGL